MSKTRIIIDWHLRGSIYRAAMKLAHHFDWHHASVIGPFEPGDGHDFQRWCKWCGFRQNFRDAASIEAELNDAARRVRRATSGGDSISA